MMITVAPSHDFSSVPFEVVVHAGHDGRRVVAVRGDVDLVTARDLTRCLRAAVTEGPVTVDLTGVEFFSSAGVTAIEDVVSDAPTAIDVVISPSPRVRRTLGVLGLTRLVTVVASVEPEPLAS
ncbi:MULTISPECIES: STAS domain-containing protein [unclassified Rhodococcus (in: high G+C Gram-positive bacteria)]|nr:MULTISPECIES: STAS domain-containing protein [unclassified Rhodococcus (in: high G+C Gram-positive bacteria)]MBY6640991.1 STAS domain-containing protein [Rhodococcus sp. BP-340]MBY6672604.1 STAS domain-containing protein [Rhodococcus sp. BP-333]